MQAAVSINQRLRRIPIWPGYIVGFVPAAWLLWLGVNNRLGANPVNTLERELGEIALQLLIASLLVTPVLQVTRINLIRFRRLIGLMAFYYAAMHFAVYLFLDLRLNWGQVFADLTKRPYIIMGFSALVLLVPVALTSNDMSVRRLGATAWRSVHKLVYPAVILGAAHYVWLVKSWPAEPLVYAAIAIALVLWRPLARRRKQRLRTA